MGKAVEPVSTGSSKTSLSLGAKRGEATTREATPEAPSPTGREEIALFWGARAGAATALVGLGRGREALSEVAAAMEYANQVCVWRTVYDAKHTIFLHPV